MRQFAGWCAVALVAIVPLVGCAPFGQGSPAEDPLVSALRGPYSAHSVDAVVQALARVGVGVYASTGSSAPMRPVSTPEVPLKFLEWQARNLAIEATTPGAGLGGDDLDQIASVAGDEVPTSYLISAYVMAGRTKGAAFARGLLGARDWAHPETITFPTLVLVLFIADALHAAQGEQLASRSASAIQLSGASNLCTTLVNWADQVFSSIFNLLKFAPSSNALLNFLVTVWNGGVGLLEQAVRKVISAFTAPIEAIVRTIIATIGIAALAKSFLDHVKVSLSTNPIVNSFADHPGIVFAAIRDPNAVDWPEELSACFAALNIQLPPLNGANRDPLTWVFKPLPGGAARITAMQANLDDANKARLDYVTGDDIAACFHQTDAVLKVQVFVHRLDKQKLIDFLTTFLGGEFPGLGDIIGPILGPPLRKLLNDVIAPIAAIADETDTIHVLIEHRVLPSPACATPTPTEPPSPSASPQQFGIGYCDQLIHPGDTIAPVVNPSERVAPGAIFVLNCPLGDPADPNNETLAKGFVVYYRYPSAFGAQQFMGELLANGAASVTGVGDQAVVIPNCQRMIGATPFPASCAVARLCNQIVEARIQGQDALALVSLILTRLPKNCPTNQAPSIPPSPLPTPLPPTLPPSPTPTPS